MKKILILITVSLLFGSSILAQQVPMTESYFVNRYALSPSYAGNSENGYLMASYMQYWSGISDGPKTLRLSYHQGFKEKKLGLGGNIIMDKVGAFQTFYGMATYSYRLNLDAKDRILFGLSAGLIKSSVNLTQFMNDPIYSSDPTLTHNDLNTRAKFASELSLVYVRNQFQLGVMFSNINFGNNTYKQSLKNYSPFLTYQVHAFYTIPFNEMWRITTLAIYRGGKNIRNQFEIGGQLKYSNRLWFSLAFRGENIFSTGLGLNISKKVMINYSYDFATGKSFNALQIHEFTLGIKL